MEASYLTLNSALTVDRTIEVRPEVQVDVDKGGYIVGVERIGGTVDVDTLAAVLRTLRVER
jgi:uncharacterized protein YuzE